jgi:hypothetical protein
MHTKSALEVSKIHYSTFKYSQNTTDGRIACSHVVTLHSSLVIRVSVYYT